MLRCIRIINGYSTPPSLWLGAESRCPASNLPLCYPDVYVLTSWWGSPRLLLYSRHEEVFVCRCTHVMRPSIGRSQEPSSERNPRESGANFGVVELGSQLWPLLYKNLIACQLIVCVYFDILIPREAMMVSQNLLNMKSGYGLLFDSTKPLGKLTLICHLRGFICFTWGLSHKKYARHQSPKCAKLYFRIMI